VNSYTNPEYTTDVQVSVGSVTATFHVEILAAIPERDRGGYRPDELTAKHAKALTPTLRITTMDTYDECARPVVIRKRDYTVDVVRMFADYGAVQRWESDHQFYGARGLRNDRGGSVEYRTATHNQLDELVGAARDAFVADNPDWAKRSVARALLKAAGRARSEAAELRTKADAHETRADGLIKAMEAL
jgi:hypothetical protein